MRVLHLHRIRGISGSERHLLTLLPALRERGVDARFLGLDDTRTGDPSAFYSELERLDVPCARVPAPRDLSPLLAARAVARVRGQRPDVVHTHLVHADVYGAVAAAAAGSVLVSTKHNDDPFRAGAFRVVERLLARRSARVVAITEALARFNVDRVGLPARKLAVVRYGLDAAPVETGTRPSVRDDVRLLLSVGRLVPQKGHDVTLRALAELRAEHADVELAILGEGVERAALEALASDLGVSEALHLPGDVDNVGDWLARADVFLHAARWEGFGLVLLEAMLAARPVVAAGVSSIPELVVDRETGRVVPAEDPGALAAATLPLLDDDGARRRLGDAGRRRAIDEFSVARMADATVAVYEDAVARRRATSRMRSAQDSTV